MDDIEPRTKAVTSQPSFVSSLWAVLVSFALWLARENFALLRLRQGRPHRGDTEALLAVLLLHLPQLLARLLKLPLQQPPLR
jgi:hypothetical protein